MKHKWVVLHKYWQNHEAAEMLSLVVWCKKCGAIAYTDEDHKGQIVEPQTHTLEYPNTIDKAFNKKLDDVWPNCLTLEENADNEG